VGKTFVSAALMLCLRHREAVRYWKPIQTGIEMDDDTQMVRELAGCSKSEVWNTGYRFERPVSPHLAASFTDTKIELRTTMRFIDRGKSEGFWIVEGAGGVLVPLNDQDTMGDLMRRLGLPVIIVSRPTLGTINHTLLTIEALSKRYIDIAGIIMNGGYDNYNRKAIEHFGGVPVLAHLPQFKPPFDYSLREWAIENRHRFDSIH
jgi:dethiobiotin synthase